MPLEEEGRSRQGGQSGGWEGRLLREAPEASSASQTVQVGSAQPRRPSTLAEVADRGWA